MFPPNEEIDKPCSTPFVPSAACNDVQPTHKRRAISRSAPIATVRSSGSCCAASKGAQHAHLEKFPKARATCVCVRGEGRKEVVLDVADRVFDASLLLWAPRRRRVDPHAVVPRLLSIRAVEGCRRIDLEGRLDHRRLEVVGDDRPRRLSSPTEQSVLRVREGTLEDVPAGRRRCSFSRSIHLSQRASQSIRSTQTRSGAKKNTARASRCSRMARTGYRSSKTRRRKLGDPILSQPSPSSPVTSTMSAQSGSGNTSSPKSTEPCRGGKGTASDPRYRRSPDPPGRGRWLPRNTRPRNREVLFLPYIDLILPSPLPSEAQVARESNPARWIWSPAAPPGGDLDGIPTAHTVYKNHGR